MLQKREFMQHDFYLNPEKIRKINIRSENIVNDNERSN
jgi:hypothetical protein